MDAVPSSARAGEIHRADFPGRAHGGASCQLRLPIPLQVLRRDQVSDGRQKSEPPSARRRRLAHLQREYAIDAVQFYDNNFFLARGRRGELAALDPPLKLKWWCEGRIDALLRYSDDTMRAAPRRLRDDLLGRGIGLRRSCCARWTSSSPRDQILEIAARIRKFGIIPEFSFVDRGSQ